MTTFTLDPAVVAARRAARLTSMPAPEPARPAATIPATASTILADWQRRWPALFNPIAPVPLAIGIRQQMHATGIPHSQLKRGLSVWCSCRCYLRSLATGDARFGLDEVPAGGMTEAQQTRAKEMQPPGQAASR